VEVELADDSNPPFVTNCVAEAAPAPTASPQRATGNAKTVLRFM
jgi:hypothetical protein